MTFWRAKLIFFFNAKPVLNIDLNISEFFVIAMFYVVFMYFVTFSKGASPVTLNYFSIYQILIRSEEKKILEGATCS